jgi:hypothetical protein
MRFAAVLFLLVFLLPAFACAGELAAKRAVDDEYETGKLYYNGLSVPADYAEAAKWMHKAAAHGFAKAQTALGVM